MPTNEAGPPYQQSAGHDGLCHCCQDGRRRRLPSLARSPAASRAEHAGHRPHRAHCYPFASPTKVHASARAWGRCSCQEGSAPWRVLVRELRTVFQDGVEFGQILVRKSFEYVAPFGQRAARRRLRRWRSYRQNPHDHRLMPRRIQRRADHSFQRGKVLRTYASEKC
jgi:hypothetical protein